MTPQEIIQETDHLFSLPDVVLRVNQLLECDKATVSDIGEVISNDPALTAKLLRLVNSAFYGFPSQVDSISRATSLIGTNEIRSLVMASSAVSMFRHVSIDLIDMGSYWQRCVYCGLIAKKIACVRRKGKGESEFLTGLLHDIGKLVLVIHHPADYEQVLRVARAKGAAMAELEEEWLGFTSAELGAQLLSHWQLPETLWKPVRHQHHPQACDDFLDEALTLNLALQITDSLEPQIKAGAPRYTFGQLDAPALQQFNLSEEDLNLITMEALVEALEVLNIIKPTGRDG